VKSATAKKVSTKAGAVVAGKKSSTAASASRPKAKLDAHKFEARKQHSTTRVTQPRSGGRVKVG